MPCSASAAASADSGRLCSSPGVQASSTGRPLRGSGAFVTPRSTPAAVSASRCSTSTPSPVAAHRSPIATSTGPSSSSQARPRPGSSHRPLQGAADGAGVQRHRRPGQAAYLGGRAGQREHPAARTAGGRVGWGGGGLQVGQAAGRPGRPGPPVVAAPAGCPSAIRAASAGGTPSSTSRRIASSRAMSARE